MPCARTRLSSREALGKLLGAGRRTFYAQFKRYKLPDWERPHAKRGRGVLLTSVTDEDCTLLTDHLWATLPPSPLYCCWALEPRTVLRIEAEVGQYETRRYDYSLCRLVGLTDYCFEEVFAYEPVKHFPVITPRFERDCAAFFDKLLLRPELVRCWSRYPSLAALPETVLPSPLPLFRS
jgi:hypothetical protein